MLLKMVDRPEMDRTGVTGIFDFQMEWAGDEKADNAADAPSLFTALQEQLGLKLQPDKIPVAMVVVDRCDKAPTEN